MKTLATLAAAALLCCATAHAQTATGTAAAAPGAGSRLDDVLARGTLRVCTTGDYKPYSYYRADGRFEG
ncbi:ArtI protein, partial [Escherichia coli]|nr:ArtI protein [Escherichia coli]